MLSAKKIMYKKISLFGLASLLGFAAQAQNENSPYSRYGLGDVVPSQHVINRGMGGVSAAYYDFQSVNFVNPASYARLKVTTLDIGAEIDSRTIRTTNPVSKFNGVSPTISYLQVGIPLSTKRNWGMNIGLRPLTRINYNIQSSERLPGIDSVRTIYKGTGGSYQVYAGTGFSVGKFSLGINAGYLFGTKEYNRERYFIPDSVYSFYYPGAFRTKANYGGFFFNYGVQFRQKLSKKTYLQLGAYGNVKQTLNGRKDEIIETFRVDIDGTKTIDSVSTTLNVKGDVIYPQNFGVGFMINSADRILFGADYSMNKWSEYRFLGEADRVQDSWKFNVGGQLLPNILNPKSYWGRVAYRAGFMYGKDYIKVNEDLPVYSITFGMGLPMRKAQYTNQYSVIHTSLEVGQRGSKDNLIRENYFRFALGFTLSDIWFIKRKYD